MAEHDANELARRAKEEMQRRHARHARVMAEQYKLAYLKAQRAAEQARKTVGNFNFPPPPSWSHAASASMGPTVQNWQPEPAASTPELPLAFDNKPIVGWRTWHLVSTHDRDGSATPRLQSIGSNPRVIWHPYEPEHARCLRFTQHLAPERACACGVWALRDRAAVVRHYGANEAALATLPYVIIGPVALWGRVLEFKGGWRAEYAYPLSLELWNTEEIAQALQQAYGVPVTGHGLAERSEEMIEVSSFGVAGTTYIPGGAYPYTQMRPAPSPWVSSGGAGNSSGIVSFSVNIEPPPPPAGERRASWLDAVRSGLLISSCAILFGLGFGELLKWGHIL